MFSTLVPKRDAKVAKKFKSVNFFILQIQRFIVKQKIIFKKNFVFRIILCKFAIPNRKKWFWSGSSAG